MLLVLFNPYIGPYQVLPRQSGPGSNGNEGELRITQSTSITGTSPSDCLVSYPGHSLRCSQCILKPQPTRQCVIRETVAFPKNLKVPVINKHLKMARGYIGWNVVEITIKMKTIVRKTLMIKNHIYVILINFDIKLYLGLLLADGERTSGLTVNVLFNIMPSMVMNLMDVVNSYNWSYMK